MFTLFMTKAKVVADGLRDIPGYEGIYSVTSDGRVWSKEREIRCGSSIKIVRGRWLKPAYGTGGYLSVVLARDGKKKTRKVARLVAEAWIPNPENLPVVNHRNGKKDDDRIENLEWCTYSHNLIHAYSTGLTPRVTPGKREAGLRRGKASRKLTAQEIAKVFEMRSVGMLQRDIGEHFGVVQTVISRILSGETYQEISLKPPAEKQRSLAA